MNGDVLWGWQSQLEDGSWSLIAMFLAAEDVAQTRDVQRLRAAGVELHVLVHRDAKIARAWRNTAMAHRDRYGQPIRFARFDLGMVVDEIAGRD